MTRALRDLLCARRGAITVELALFIPLFMLVMWFGAEACHVYRTENTLHRSTAALADILANETLNEDETLPARLSLLPESALLLLREMMGDTMGESLQVGLSITYYDTSPGSDGVVQASFSAGMGCPAQEVTELADLTVGGGGLTTEENAAQMELVRVEACVREAERLSFRDWVFPTEFSSNFTAMRKEW